MTLDPVTVAVAACPDLTALQRAAGYATWHHLLQLAGVALAATGCLLFASGLVRHLMRHLRLLEAGLWLLAIAALAAGHVVAPADRAWPVLLGALLLPGAAAFGLYRRRLPFDPRRHLVALALAWTALALLHQLAAVGFLAVAAWLGAIGLLIAVGPFCYLFGFRSHEALVRGTLAGALLAGVAMLLAATGASAGALDVLRPAALWLGTFAWFLGLLIASFKWFARESYLARQALAAGSMAGTLSIGLLFAIREATVMAAAFLLFYLLAKLVELPAKGRLGLGLKFAAAGGVLFGVWRQLA